MSFSKNGKEPKKCTECGKQTKFNYRTGEYNKYCVDHKSLALSEQTKRRIAEGNSPFDFGWKRGLTKEDNEGIASQSRKISGENNPQYGKPLTEEQKRKKKETIKITGGNKLTEEEFTSKLQKRNDIIFIGNYSEYGKKINKNLKFKCNNCQHEFFISLIGFEEGVRCPNCRENPSKRQEVREKISATLRMSEEEYFKRTVTDNKSDFEVLEPYENYKVQKNQPLSVRCKKCGDITTRTLATINAETQCHICHPDSKEEQSIKKYLDSLGIEYISNSRKLIAPYELDIVIPEYKFAIEYNGLFWHTENTKKENYHYEKTKRCNELGYSLIHIFSDEYFEKPEIIKSMICHKINLDKIKISARKCIIKELSLNEQMNFFEKNHINGHVQSIKSFGLIYDNEIVCAISLRKPFHKEKYEDCIEIARFACKLYTTVQGGLSKLLNKVKQWAVENNYKNIITYADLRFGYSGVYEKIGFIKQHQTEIDYWYTDGKVRYNRFKFRAQKENNLTEKQVAEKNKVFKVYGCGSYLFSLPLSLSPIPSN